MADIHGVPSEAMMTPVQGFTSEPLPDLAAAARAAEAVANGPRQDEARQLLESPPGFALDGFDVMSGGTAGWPADIEPGG